MKISKLFGPLAAASLAMGMAASGAAIAGSTTVMVDSGSLAAQNYVYYPKRAIYHDPARKLWFWSEDGNWQSGDTLPAHLQQWTTRGMQVSLKTDRPYEFQAQMERKFGPQLREEQTAEYRAYLRHSQQARN